MADKVFHLLPVASWSALITTLPLIYFSAAPLAFLLFPEHANLVPASEPCTHCPLCLEYYSLEHLPGRLSHFIQVFDQLSHPQRGLYWLIYLRRNFLTLHSFTLLFFFTVRLMTCYHITYSFVCLLY